MGVVGWDGRETQEGECIYVYISIQFSSSVMSDS